MVDVKFSLGKRDFVWIGLIVVLVGVGFGYAYGGDNPAVMGHSAGEVEIVVDDVFCAKISGHACGYDNIGESLDYRAELGCSGGDVYWYDSNGDLSFKEEDCVDGCYEGSCISCIYRSEVPVYWWVVWANGYGEIQWNGVHVANNVPLSSGVYISGGYRYTQGVFSWSVYETNVYAVCRSPA